MASHTISWCTHILRMCGQFDIRSTIRPLDICGVFMLDRWGHILAHSRAFGCNRHQLVPHAARFALGLNIVSPHRGLTNQTERLPILNGSFARLSPRPMNLISDALSVNDRLYITLLTLLSAKPERFHQRHFGAAGRVGAGNSARPNPCYDISFRSIRKPHSRVKPTDTLLSF